MILRLNPLLDAFQAARNAAPNAINADDEVTVDDQGSHWIFEFVPRGDVLGGGARISIAKDNLRVLSVVSEVKLLQFTSTLPGFRQK